MARKKRESFVQRLGETVEDMADAVSVAATGSQIGILELAAEEELGLTRKAPRKKKAKAKKAAVKKAVAKKPASKKQPVQKRAAKRKANKRTRNARRHG